MLCQLGYGKKKKIKKKMFCLKYITVPLRKKENPYKLGFMAVLPIYSISVGKPDEKPLVLLCGWAMPCSCAWS